MSNLEELDKMEKLGFKLIGDLFARTFTHAEIQKRRREIIRGSASSTQ